MIAFAAAFLAQFTEPVCCALSPDVCCSGEILGVATPPTSPSGVSSQVTNGSERGCSGCCDGARFEDPAEGTNRGPSIETNQRSCPAPIQTCGCERDRGTADASTGDGKHHGKQDGKRGDYASSARDVVNASPRGVDQTPRLNTPLERWRTDAPPTPLRI